MNFAHDYFTAYKNYPQIFDEEINDGTNAIVVIPCYDDDFIFNTLNSLNDAIQDFIIEVIVIVNSGENTQESIINSNRQIFGKLKEYKNNYKFRLLPANFESLPAKTAGVGLARKIGMDEAIRRYVKINNPAGIIISLDADCLVSRDYFSEILLNFGKAHKRFGAATFNFQHNFDLQIFSKEEIDACKIYEKYLRDFRSALQMTGFPHSFYTIGSCFAVKAMAYIKVGGMSQHQGGEDFYFLHKIAKMTNVLEIEKPIVFPAPRISDRVPFGTGPAVKKIITQKEYKVYDWNLFLLLKDFYHKIDTIYTSSDFSINQIPLEILNFIGKDKYKAIINECKANTKTFESFKKRFISKFDAFWIIKFLNFHSA